MLTYISRRALYSIPVVLLASFLMFAIVRATYDPTARLRSSHDVHAVQRERERFGLDRPIFVQYGDYIGKFLTGDWGTSEHTRESIFSMITTGLGYTIQLIVWGVLVSVVVAILIGVYSAIRQYSALDYTFTGLAFIGLAMPPFWFGLLAIQFLVIDAKDWFHSSQPLLYSVGLHSSDSGGINLDYFQHLALPVLTLTVQIVASWSRFVRASMLDVLSADYIRTARAKGVPRRKVVFRHALRNALIPFVTVTALDIGALFGGLIITESIFAVPGMGRLFFDSLKAGDAPVLTAWVVVTALFIVVFNLIADLLYSRLDPRVRLA